MAISPKQKKCKSKCGKEGLFSIKTKGMCYDCYYKWLYGTDEGREKVALALKRARIQREKAAKNEVRDAAKKARMMNKGYEKLLQSEINKLARLIDFGQKCLARDIPIKKVDGGHVKARGGNMSARYNLHNIFAQSAASNHWQNDDLKMHEGLERVFGKEYRDFNDSLRATPKLKYTESDYEQFCKIVRRINREMSKNLTVASTHERIEMRNRYNLEIGIYSEQFAVFMQSEQSKKERNE